MTTQPDTSEKNKAPIIEAVIVDQTVICLSFPEMPERNIERDNILDTIDRILDTDIELVIVEGTDGIGKTVLMAQFAKRHAENSVSLFVRPTGRWAYDPDVLRYDICYQLEWMLYQKEVPLFEAVDDGFLRDRLIKLRRKLRYQNETCYLVVDGLNDIDPQIKHTILDFLPWGFQGFRFLLSGQQELLTDGIHNSIKYKTQGLPGFTPDESARYLEDSCIDRGMCQEVHRTLRGIPGNLASVRRLIKSGIDVASLLDDMPEKLPEPFEIEWQEVSEYDHDQLIILAVLSFDSNKHTIETLASLLGFETEVVKHTTGELGFLNELSPSNEVRYVSESFRRFAREKLDYLEQDVNDLVIRRLLANPEGDEALTHLPSYLKQSDRLDELVNYLSSEHISRIMGLGQSLVPVKEKASLGIEASITRRRYGDAMRFSILRSIAIQFDGTAIWQSEIEALTSLKDYDSAMALAQSAVLREERMHLLALIAKAQHDQGLTPDSNIVDQVYQEYAQLEVEKLDAEKAIEIASDLLYVASDLAIEMVEKTTSMEDSGNDLAWALVRFSLAAQNLGDRSLVTPGIDDITNTRISDPITLRFLRAASLVMTETSAEETISRVERISGAEEQMFLLSQWCMKNRERSDSLDVVEYALNLSITATQYSPNATIYRQLSAPIPHSDGITTIKRIIRTLDAQKSNIERYGPTEDFARLQMTIAQAERSYDFNSAKERILEIYFFIHNIEELSIKTALVARLCATITELDPDMALEEHENMHSLFSEELETLFEELLDSTAFHYHTSRSIIRALAKTQTIRSSQLITKLNTEMSRDSAYLDLVESFSELPADKLDLSLMNELIQKINSKDIQDNAVLFIMQQLRSITPQPTITFQAAAPILGRIDSIRDASDKCEACCHACAFLRQTHSDASSGMLNHLMSVLEKSWRSIDPGWQKVHVGFLITTSFAEDQLDVAKHYLDETEKLRVGLPLDTHGAGNTYILSLMLAIRAYGGLLPRNLEFEKDFEQLGQLIDTIPSHGERALLWSYLAITYFLASNKDRGRAIVSDRIIPLIRTESIRDERYRCHVISLCAPALYYAHERTAHEILGQLDTKWKNLAYSRIIGSIFTQCLPSDPYNYSNITHRHIDYQNLTDLCALIECLEIDHLIYAYIKHVADIVSYRHGGARYTREQQNDIANRLEQIIATKLPTTGYIAHQGYVIAARAQVSRIRRSGTQGWLDLIEEARSISNLADRALVLGTISEAMPNRESSRRKDLLLEARDLAGNIPVALDKLDRYIELASVAVKFDVSFFRETLQMAASFALDRETPDFRAAQKRMVDLAYQYDEGFAASLAALVDDDPARNQASSIAAKRLHLLEIKKNMTETVDYTDRNIPLEENDYARAAWMTLGGLNAGRVTSIRIADTLETVRFAAGSRLDLAYPMLAWIIENAKIHYSHTDQASTYLRSLFEAMISGTIFASQMAQRSSTNTVRIKQHIPRKVATDSIFIRSGERDKAIAFLKQWLKENSSSCIKICDPFFGPGDLPILQLIRTINRECTVNIVTSKKHQVKESVSQPWADTYRAYWRMEVSDQDPPQTEIIIVGTAKTGESPIHDRWLVAQGKGIRFGTSFQSFGVGKGSEISILSEESAIMLETEADRYIQRTEREHLGENLSYDLFTL